MQGFVWDVVETRSKPDPPFATGSKTPITPGGVMATPFLSPLAFGISFRHE